ncbi:MAG: chain-length determining protein [Gammaproteobacteria bacterium]|nr:MAG: chain-length determining protein [Gammaproteobacteria bacterium]
MTLDNLFRIFFARWRTIAITTGIAVVLAAIVTAILPRTYTATTDLIIDLKDQDPISGQVQQPRALASYVGTQAVIIQSPNVARKVIDELKLTANPILAEQLHFKDDEDSRKRALMAFLDNGLSVTPAQNSTVFSIAFSARDPNIAANLANTFAEVYMKTNLELRIEPAKQINQWYDEQLASLRETLIEQQNALASYQEKHDIIASSDRLDLESNRLAELSSMLIAAQGERLNNTSRNDQISNGIRSGIPAQAMENPIVQRLSGELAQAQSKLSDTALRVGENHPQYIQALSDVESVKSQLQQAVRAVSGSLKSSLELSQSREEQLSAELAAQKERVLQLSRTRNELNLLKQEVDNAQTTYDQALGRSTKTKLESRVAQTDIALLNPAEVPSRPSSPKTSMNLVLALIAGFLFGSALALGQEWLDRRVRSSYDLEHGLGLPVLAYLPATISIKPSRKGLIKGALS